MEPKDWMNTGLEDEGGEGEGAAPPASGSAPGKQGGPPPRTPRGFDVELKRKAGEGFGFVIASQDVENVKGEEPAAGYEPRGYEATRLLGYEPRGYEARGYEARGYKARVYEPRGYEPRGYEPTRLRG